MDAVELEVTVTGVLLICVESTDDSEAIIEFVAGVDKLDCFVKLLLFPTIDDVDSDVLFEIPSDKLDRSVELTGTRKLSNSSKLDTTLAVELLCCVDTLESSPLLEAFDCSLLNVDFI